ncbi:MAG TPA: thermonuclease, partial [Pseudobacillus sp.]
MRKLIVAFCMVIFLILGGCAAGEQQEDVSKQPLESREKTGEPEKASSVSSKETETNNRLTGTVVYVVDGDTFDVKLTNGKEERVRMTLVDTPETKHPRLGVQPFGPEA